jgi:hypothetical protein
LPGEVTAIMLARVTCFDARRRPVDLGFPEGADGRRRRDDALAAPA